MLKEVNLTSMRKLSYQVFEILAGTRKREVWSWHRRSRK